ncbi:zeta toxin-domain-containing protein [Hypoxylon rubiginosum]|uniref:Zeta toxin-domain-containing protein n=1 Tax=Hypoxylon rubiginosum TaxID=110542 RepID=A0ACC0DJV2_9PEZI|nr:zeta toxin-domain-containing protein [Hypoxylon rubiginosum]
MDDSSSDPQSYVLSADESRAIFERDIVPAELGALLSLSPPPPQANGTTPDLSDPIRTPLAVLLVGQTGAGKTRTAPAIKHAIKHLRGSSSAHLAHFVADTYKTYHPAYRSLLTTHPSLASPATAPDARRWLSMAASRAASARIDVLLESAARHPADFAELAKVFRGVGYRVEVVVLAVPAALSRLGVLARFHGKEAQGGKLPVRLTPRGVHDASYAGLLEAAAFVDAEGAVDQVVVVRRDNMVAYANERTGGRWRRGDAGVAAAVRMERERPLTPGEKAGAEATLRMLRGLGMSGLASQLAEMEELLKPLMGGDLDNSVYAPLRPLSLPSSTQDGNFDVEAGLRLGVVS